MLNLKKYFDKCDIPTSKELEFEYSNKLLLEAVKKVYKNIKLDSVINYLNEILEIRLSLHPLESIGCLYVMKKINEVNILQNITLNMGGLHNVENATAAIAIALTLGIEDDKIKNAVNSFKGVKRRFEYKVKTASKILIDDYAHHPEELNALISGVRSIFPNEKMVLVFQPHLYSRTQDQCDGFVATLDQADEVILLPIYPARELPIPGVTSDMLLDKMKLQHKRLMTKEELMDWAATTQDKLIVMAGAGDIDACIIQVQAILNPAS
jgi:UDP-N-acetylmuramate--alanine ligase